ncbi:MAG: hypothetical protein AABW89_05410 [Nanoarchaeota archaeon]
MVNRKGFVRVAELLIAVTVISIVLLISYKQTVPNIETQDLSELARDLLSEISLDEDLRTEIIVSQTNSTRMIRTKDFINSSVPDYIEFELRACDVSNACGQSSYVGDVFSAERIISTSKHIFNPVKIRLFLWVE